VMNNDLSVALLLQSLGEVGSTIFVVLAGMAVIEATLYVVLKVWLQHHLALPIMLLAPGIIGLALLMAYPLVYEFRLAFSNMTIQRFQNPDFSLAIGAKNFIRVFTEPVLQQVGFFPIFLRTVLWTAMQVSVHVVLGLFLAILMNRPMRFRGLYRTLIIVPWAMPQVVVALAWRGEFNYRYGFPNIMLQRLGFEAISWKSDPFWNFIAMNIVNWWLGVPFMMVILLGALQSIDRNYYEAAEIDGANGWQQFRHVTVPMIKPVMTPAITLGVIWTWNNFYVPYFVNQQELESSEILVTALFRAVFNYFRYGFGAAFAIVAFVILLAFTIFYMRMSGFRPSLTSSGARLQNVAGEHKPRKRRKVAAAETKGGSA
jgi:arabinogalactan oligomer/maltooligosaccharide transport system permease protein